MELRAKTSKLFISSSASDDETQIRRLLQCQSSRLDERVLGFLRHERADAPDDWRVGWKKQLRVHAPRFEGDDALDVDALVDDDDLRAGDAVGDQTIANRATDRKKAIHLRILPSGERVRREAVLDAPRRHENGPRRGRGDRQSRCRHGDRMRVVGVDDRRSQLSQHARQPPRRR
jgi:hypothetical protein